MIVDFEYVRGCSGWFAILITSTFIRGCYLQYANFLSLSGKGPVIVSFVIPAHSLRSREKLNVSPNKTYKLIGVLIQSELAEWSR